MKQTLLTIFMIAGLGISTQLAAQETKKEPKLVETERNTSPNPEVKKLKEAINTKASNTPGANNVPKQSGPVYGPDYCDVVIDNYTNLYIKVWVDDNYKGIVAPYGKITVAAIPGSTKMYCRADFTDGSYYWWGPNRFQCDYEFTWRLK